MNRVALQRPFDRDAVPKIAGRLILRIEFIDLPVRVVIQRQLCARTLPFEAFIRFSKGFVDRAAAVDYDTGPGSGIHVAVLPSRRDPRNANERHGERKCELGH